jgi:hypothetical protein
MSVLGGVGGLSWMRKTKPRVAEVATANTRSCSKVRMYGRQSAGSHGEVRERMYHVPMTLENPQMVAAVGPEPYQLG